MLKLVKKQKSKSKSPACPITLAEYNAVAADYVREAEAWGEANGTTLESRFMDVLSSDKANDVEFERIDEEMHEILYSQDSAGAAQHMALSRIFALGIELGFRLGKQQK